MKHKIFFSDPVFFDIEVFSHDNLVVLKQCGMWYSYWSEDWKRLQHDIYVRFNHKLFIGFNNSHYDNMILQAISSGLDVATVHDMSRHLIEDGSLGYVYDVLRRNRCPRLPILFADTAQDLHENISLKEYEAKRGLSVEESSVSFTIPRRLTQSERDDVEHYCRADVSATEKLFYDRYDYFVSKRMIIERFHLPNSYIRFTDAILCEKLFAVDTQTAPKPTYRQDYVLPDNCRMLEFSPILQHPTVKSWLSALHRFDNSFHDDDFTLTIGNCSITLSAGGIHGCIGDGRYVQPADKDVYLIDVKSYYPNLIYNYRYLPFRSISNNGRNLLKQLLDIKNTTTNRAEASTVKTIINSLSGSLRRRGGRLYDPLSSYSVCVTGQLLLLALAYDLHRDIPAIKIIQMNTDGIMVEIDPRYYDRTMLTVRDWCHDTDLSVSVDKVTRLHQWNVNNYVCVLNDDHIKTVGPLLSDTASGMIIKKAVIDKLLFDKPITDTIMSDNDMYDFQLVTKSTKRAEFTAVYYPNGTYRVVNRVNRCYAAVDKKHSGTLCEYSNNKPKRLRGLPDHVFIFNKDSNPPVDMVDRSWYISKAEELYDKLFVR